VLLLIPSSVAQRLAEVLKRRGLTESGGILMGEHVSAEEFRIVDFTVPHAKGTFASFLRIPQFHLRGLKQFFRRTGNDYRKFNYIGEWHSHPAFSTRPSDCDLAAMHALVNDAAMGATFAVLMVVRLDNDVALQIGTYLFVPTDPAVYVIPLVLETDQVDEVGLKEHALEPATFRFAGKAGAAIRLVSNPDVVDRICG
jgi:proteasome lid subunit RPN8/RPN11